MCHFYFNSFHFRQLLTLWNSCIPIISICVAKMVIIWLWMRMTSTYLDQTKFHFILVSEIFINIFSRFKFMFSTNRRRISKKDKQNWNTRLKLICVLNMFTMRLTIWIDSDNYNSNSLNMQVHNVNFVGPYASSSYIVFTIIFSMTSNHFEKNVAC